MAQPQIVSPPAGASGLAVYTKATAPDPATLAAGTGVYVSDATVGSRSLYSDGTQYRRFGSDVVVVLFDPTAYPGLLRSFQANTLSALANNAQVASWPDDAGVTPATQATSGQQPLYKASAQNGQPAVYFDGVDDTMDFGALSTIRSAYFVVQWAGADDIAFAPILGHPTLYDWHGENSGADLLLRVGTSNDDIMNGSAWVNGVSTAPADIPRVAGNAFRIISFSTLADVNAQRITNDRTFGRYWRGHYAVILLYSAVHTTPQRQDIETKLNAQYAIY